VVLLTLVPCAIPRLARADPRLPSVLSDHMVLQREKPVAIWGWAEPGEVVRVEIQDARTEAVTGADGRWRAMLPALAAGGPFDLTVQGMTTIVIHDVLVGEVWVCAGQSNMNFPLIDSDTGTRDVPAADDRMLRFFTVRRRSTLEAMSDTTGAWTASTPPTAGAFSAVGYYFGAELRRSLGVPVGLVQASWSGTAGEEWSDLATLRRSDPSPNRRALAAGLGQREGDVRRAAPVRIEIEDVEVVLANGASMSRRFRG
jgi:sialate O-acetylesterase